MLTQWMLFCDYQEVNAVWAAVARATATNDLGIAAKVATGGSRNEVSGPNNRRPRLICIYTQDFTDEADVVRVLQKLRKLGLVTAQGTIHYKTGKSHWGLVGLNLTRSALTDVDAYTHLDIYANNPWGLKASLYSSTELFKQGKAKK
jgi:hypothetical protein